MPYEDTTGGRKMKKALYILWPDTYRIAQSIEAGIDTLLVAMYTSRPDIPQAELFGTYDQIVSLLGMLRRNHPKVQILLVPTWYLPNWAFMPVEEQFMAQGKRYAKTPCPTSTWHIDWVMEYPLGLLKQGMCDGLIFDMEHYGYGSDTDILPYYLDEGSALRCECPRCDKLDIITQRRTQAGNIKYQLLRGNCTVSGCMPYSNPWLMQAWTGKTTPWYNEYTYKKFASRRVKPHVKANRKMETPIEAINGIWAEWFTAQGLLKYIEEVGSSPLSDGIWIYPQARFSVNSKMTAADKDAPPYIYVVDYEMTNFFGELKNTFSRIEKNRKGFWFGLKRWWARLLQSTSFF
jgi:hypothetical protein